MLGATGLLSALAADLSCASCLEGVPNSVEDERFSVVFRHMVVQWSGTITQWGRGAGNYACWLVGNVVAHFCALRLRRHFDFIGLRLSMPRQHKMIRSIDLLVHVTNVLFYGFVLPKIESNESGRRTHTAKEGEKKCFLKNTHAPLTFGRLLRPHPRVLGRNSYKRLRFYQMFPRWT